MIWIAIINEVSSNWQIIIISDIFLLKEREKWKAAFKIIYFQQIFKHRRK